jgi:hypothetical protein
VEGAGGVVSVEGVGVGAQPAGPNPHEALKEEHAQAIDRLRDALKEEGVEIPDT